MAIFECVGLVTHEKASEVLFTGCERRVRILNPLFESPPSSPSSSPPPILTDSGEQIASALAPPSQLPNWRPIKSEDASFDSVAALGVTASYPPFSQDDYPQKLNFLNELDLTKQHPVEAHSESYFKLTTADISCF